MQQNLDMYFDKIIKFRSDSFQPVFCEDGDFWRLHLDYCTDEKNNELGLYSSAQTPDSVIQEEGCITIRYSSLTAEDGSTHNITLTFKVKQKNGAILFAAEIKNNSEARVNELQYPFLELERIVGPLEEDTLFSPHGLGLKVDNPHGYTKQQHTEYMAADYKNIWNIFSYPGTLSMPWFGIESSGTFLYLGRHDECCRFTSFSTGTEPREVDTKRFIMTVSSYPAANTGETVAYGGFSLAAFSGDWRGGASFYRKWAESTWLSKYEKKESIKRLNGWQRIILKHQYGEIFHTYDELPKIYDEGAKYGLNMILLFAWWEEGMDNGYPNYRPDNRLGGAEALRQAIQEINSRGGLVVLYANGHLIDVSTDYYKTRGYKYTMKDIEGNEYREFYKFSNNGTLLRFGHKTFATGCYGVQEWQDTLCEITDRHLSLGSNGTFFDQICCCMRLCFDKSHAHGPRIDEDPQYRIEGVKRIKSHLKENDLFGTEWVMDRISPYMDFTHGCGIGMAYQDNELPYQAYPYIFRFTFPEFAVSNRFIHDEKEGWEKHLNYAFVFGLLFDVSIYRGRAESIASASHYAQYVKALIDLKSSYVKFFAEGKFDLPEEALPDKVWGAQYSLDSKTILSLWNDSENDYCLSFGIDKGKTLKPGEVNIFRIQ